MRNRKKPKSPLAKLKRECEEAWKLAVKRRDKDTCQLCGTSKREHPQTVLQVDHFFSRRNSAIFYDERNGTTLCKPCHAAKTFNSGPTNYRMYQLVEVREGMTAVEEMISKTRKLKKWTALELKQHILYLDGLFR